MLRKGNTSYIDVLVMDASIEDKRDTTYLFRGSKNQIIWRKIIKEIFIKAV